jgi:hypothetical protein
MKEGTWIEKPNRNTPPSQDRGTAGSSGGVKRPRCDSSTPSQEKQKPKKPRSTQVQTGKKKIWYNKPLASATLVAVPPGGKSAELDPKPNYYLWYIA